MTGFGRGVAENEFQQITVEARSVNHRFLEISFKLPKELLALEIPLKKMFSERLTRGKVDVFVTLKTINPKEKKVQFNWPLFEAYVQAKNEVAAKVPLGREWSMTEILAVEDMLIVSEDSLNVEELEPHIVQVAKLALENLTSMREREGQELKNVMVQLIADLQKEMADIQLHKDDAVTKYRERLLERIQAIASGEELDARIVTEVAIFAEKIDITEELDRMNSHIAQFLDTIELDEAIGRKFEFIAQEMHREINTIGSKNQSSTCSTSIVQAKMIIEKIREQVQNIE